MHRKVTLGFFSAVLVVGADGLSLESGHGLLGSVVEVSRTEKKEKARRH
jgi:hypothetical protein